MADRAVVRVALGLVAMLAGACGSSSIGGPIESPPKAALERYLREPSFRRAALVDSLVVKDNGYATLRLAHYDSGAPGDWSLAPEWNPPAATVATFGSSWSRPLAAEARPLSVSPAASEGDADALRALGEAAFFRYPLQLVDAPDEVLATDESANRFGLWRDDVRGIGGLVRAPLGDGSTGVFLSCASCHAQPGEEGRLSIGRPNAQLDLGFGHGLVDVTTAEGTEPVRIADLRPVRFVTHLHADGNVLQRDVISLAVRIETLMITGRNGLLRPPREVALGLALYLWSLAADVPAPRITSDAERRGEAIFAVDCASCHTPPAFTGPPVSLATIGTDPRVGLSHDRGTGNYRVPSLRFVSSRGPLLHDASLPSLAALLDPGRIDPAFTGGRAPGAVVGHEFGLELDVAARADLLSYLRRL